MFFCFVVVSSCLSYSVFLINHFTFLFQNDKKNKNIVLFQSILCDAEKSLQKNQTVEKKLDRKKIQVSEGFNCQEIRNTARCLVPFHLSQNINVHHQQKDGLIIDFRAAPLISSSFICREENTPRKVTLFRNISEAPDSLTLLLSTRLSVWESGDFKDLLHPT